MRNDIFSQWPKITTAPRLVPAVHSGVDRGKLGTSRGAAVFLPKYRRIRLFFGFPSSWILFSLESHPLLSGKKAPTAPRMKSESKYDSKQAVLGK